ncbi:MAG TPA: sugar ABC transporter ATP-binding protein [Solirubrobacteraceae bacterium]|nr:sugar ABC transporter ATP-binding protein [Solirubrobacteraceae bacterium]
MSSLTASEQEAHAPVRPLLEVRGVWKHFGGVQAVIDASLSFGPGRVYGLAGENGAGKSTLGKMIAGALAPDDGELFLDGEPVRFRAPRDALAAGIAVITQEIALIPNATVEQNVLLGIEPATIGLLHRHELRQRFDDLNERTGLGLSPEAQIRTMRVAAQQMVEVMRAIARGARLIVMDEPTAALTKDEAERLLGIIRTLAASGTSVLLISHYLEDLLSVCESITVMRDGRIVKTSPASEETPKTLVTAMIGHDVALEYPPKSPPPPSAPVVLEARGIEREGVLHDISLTVRAGEIVGLAGLVGSGRTEVARALFGADPIDGGEILLDDRPVRIKGPRQAARLGIVMLPESRKEEGLIMLRPVRENVTLATLDTVSTAGFINKGRERRRADALFKELDIRAPSSDVPVGTLSGGNQQKTLFAKWLVDAPRVLIADEPTRGVDVGAKRQIHELIGRLAANGMAVLLISSELEEVLGLAHRVLVMRRGAIVAEYDGEDATMERVLSSAFASDATDANEAAA